ncbi:translation initiation factor IF-2 [Thecamonas trahens ATCC 50062]|uniref:Translation initiation factor IF-2 n=1 Tax=Thecamonas trahens ATCC 50062 TaxID=461836 RepID=A0A0L0DGE9_THETB|nr:translation initiation factor IF-2 [Thecamonas trahens ATCC 50062]KNC51196.1 translation initiation factor IF-2 [Thecamonas trahens ATCC 50062]|eukprot:XP_013756396.1 translation initiation factor IF-2 [Thecamonas trahens ATCC 50062]
MLRLAFRRAGPPVRPWARALASPARRALAAPPAASEGKPVALPPHIRVRELAKLLRVPAKKVAVAVARKRGRKYHYTQRVEGREVAVVAPSLRAVVIDYASAAELAAAFGYHPIPLELGPVPPAAGSAGHRPAWLASESLARVPVVALMGHVDHGKTTLWDALAGSDEAGREPGGITQSLRTLRLLLPRDGEGDVLAPLGPPEIDGPDASYRSDHSVRAGSYRTPSKAERAERKVAWRKRVEAARAQEQAALAAGSHVPLTVVDTPGHAAFFHMREHSVLALDAMVLVVDATQGMGEQTLEVLTAAAVEKLPVFVVANKMDMLGSGEAARGAIAGLLDQLHAFEPFAPLPDADTPLPPAPGSLDVLNPQLSIAGVYPVSAKTGGGLRSLVGDLAAFAEGAAAPETASSADAEVNAVVQASAVGVVVEASLERARGSVLRVVVAEGEIKKGDTFVCGVLSGRVLNVTDATQVPLAAAGPGEGVEVMVSIRSSIRGIDSINDAMPLGEALYVVTPQDAKVLLHYREASADWQMNIETGEVVGSGADEEDAVASVDGAKDELAVPSGRSVVVKANTGGALLTLVDALRNAGIVVVHYGVGDVTPTDLEHAVVAGDATPVLCFNVARGERPRF